MCQLVTITLLCPICQVNVVGDPKFETIPCRDVRKGRSCPSTHGHGSSSNSCRVQFRQELGEQECRPCEQYTHRERDRQWAEAEAAACRYGRSAEYYYGRAHQGYPPPPYHSHHERPTSYAGRYRARDPNLSGDRELRLTSQWRWDDNYSPPPSRSASPATPTSPSSSGRHNTTSSSQQSHRASSRNGSTSSSSSSSSSSSEDHNSNLHSSESSDSYRDRGLHGDQRLVLHSARHW